MTTPRPNLRKLDPFEQALREIPVTPPPPDGISVKAWVVGITLGLLAWGMFWWGIGR